MSVHTQQPSAQPLAERRFAYVLIGLIVVWGIVLRCVQLGREGFWMDEAFGASFTNLSLYETLVAVLRFDLHPPYYYFQLNLWALLGNGNGDVWLLANSVFWSALTMIAMTWIALRRHGTHTAIFVAALLAVCGSEIFFAAELRMYALLSFLVVAGWYAADRYRASYSLRKDGLLFVLILFLLSGMHSAAFLSVSALLLYAFPWHNLSHRASLHSWLACSGLAALFLLPWLLNASFRSISHTSLFSLEGVLHTTGGWLSGYAFEHNLVIVLGGLVLIAAVVIAITQPHLRRLILCLLVWPLVMAGLVSAFYRPIWLPRVFAFSSPLFMYALAVTLSHYVLPKLKSLGGQVSASGRAFIVLLLVVASGCLVLLLNLVQHKAEYREAAALLKQEAKAGEFVYVPQNILFWGLARYSVGSEWGSLLKIQDAERPDNSERWRDIYAKLGNDKLRMLHLLAETRRLQSAVPPMIIGWSSLPELHTSPSYWVATDYSVALETLDLCAQRRVEETRFRGVLLRHVFCLSAPTA